MTRLRSRHANKYRIKGQEPGRVGQAALYRRALDPRETLLAFYCPRSTGRFLFVLDKPAIRHALRTDFFPRARGGKRFKFTGTPQTALAGSLCQLPPRYPLCLAGGMKTNETKRRDRAVRPLRRGTVSLRKSVTYDSTSDRSEWKAVRDFIPTADGNKYASPTGLQLARRHSCWRVRAVLSSG